MGKNKTSLFSFSDSHNQEERIEYYIKLLGLNGISSSFKQLAKITLQNKNTPYDFLENILEKEIQWKEDSRQQRWIQQANFPWKKSLHDFDFSFQPSIDQRLIHELASCRFIDEASNVILLGPAVQQLSTRQVY